MHKQDEASDCRSDAAADAGEGTADPVLDPQAIERLRALDPGGQQGVLRRVLQAYETSLVRQLADIRRACADTEGDAAAAGDPGGVAATGGVPVDMDLLVRTVHTLKSSSAAIGALALAQICADIERAVRTQAQMPAAAQCAALATEGERVRAAVAAMLAAS